VDQSVAREWISLKPPPKHDLEDVTDVVVGEEGQRVKAARCQRGSAPGVVGGLRDPRAHDL
jgi:hypothetical protein